MLFYPVTGITYYDAAVLLNTIDAEEFDGIEELSWVDLREYYIVALPDSREVRV